MRSVTYHCSCGEQFTTRAASRAHERANRGHESAMVLASIAPVAPIIPDARHCPYVAEPPSWALRRSFTAQAGTTTKRAAISAANIVVARGAFGTTGFNCGDRVHRIDDERHEGRVEAIVSNAISVKWDGDPAIYERGIDPRELRRAESVTPASEERS